MRTLHLRCIIHVTECEVQAELTEHRTYRGSWNFGDAMPTRVMAGLFLSPLAGVYGDAVNEFNNPEQRFVVNGWIGEKASEDSNCLICGSLYWQRS